VTTREQLDGAFLVGPRVYLRPLEPADLPSLHRWANDPELRTLTGSVMPQSMQAAAEWLDRVNQAKDRAWFGVCLRDGGRLIGETGLLRIFHPWRTADMSMIIGEKDAWGQGYAREAAELLMDYAFGNLALHRLAIGVVGFNERALRWWSSLGFREEGAQRDGYYHGHGFHDFVMMSVLEDEYRQGRDGVRRARSQE
jgi:RimJ/RimL family protein N-acetyltransferase